MLAFDYVPAAHFLSQPPLCRTPYPFSDFSLLLDGAASGPVVRRPPVRYQKIPRPRPHHHHHHHKHHHGTRSHRSHHQEIAPKSPPLAGIFGLLDGGSHKAIPEVISDVLETTGSYQLVLRKDNGSSDFRSYMIRYVSRNRHTDVIVESKEDEFEKTYRFAKSAIDINGVEWKVIEDLLVVDIPKTGAMRKSSNEPTQKEPDTTGDINDAQEEAAGFPQNKDKAQAEKLIATEESSFEQKPKRRVISIPIEFLKSSEDVKSRVSTTSESAADSTPCLSSGTSSDTDEVTTEGESSREAIRTGSDASLEDEPSPKVPKVPKKVILEDLVDESFLAHDLD